MSREITKPTGEEQAEILRAKTECTSDNIDGWFEIGFFDQYFKAFSKEVSILNDRLGELLGGGKTFVYNIASYHRNMSQRQLVVFARLLELSDSEKIKLYERVGGFCNE